MKAYFYQTDIGRIGIVEEEGSITNVCFEGEAIPKGSDIAETTVIKEAWQQLVRYLAGDLKEFSLPLAPRGTDFMKRVWEALCTVRYGETASYKSIAETVGRPRAVRAVGLANGRNPVPIFIPCHRIIGSNGKLVGYAGGLELKRKLLDLEARHRHP